MILLPEVSLVENLGSSVLQERPEPASHSLIVRIKPFYIRLNLFVRLSVQIVLSALFNTTIVWFVPWI